MDLQEKLVELSEYNVSFNVANGNFVVRVKYDGSWTIIQPDGNDISFYRDENDNTVYYYVAPVTVNIEKLFLAIDETIDYNRELEQKIVLFKKKMAELQEIFSQEPLEVLNTLEFKMKRKTAKQKKEKQTEERDVASDGNGRKEKEDGEMSEIDAKINNALKK